MLFVCARSDFKAHLDLMIVHVFVIGIAVSVSHVCSRSRSPVLSDVLGRTRALTDWCWCWYLELCRNTYMYAHAHRWVIATASF